MAGILIVHPDAAALADAVAARLVTALLDVQATGAVPGVALTGGTIGTASLAALAAAPARTAVDWSRVDLYWGDERFVAAGSADRNELGARRALLDHLPLDPARVHPMAASDGAFGTDVDAAAAGYAAALADRGAPLDVVMLGMGPEGHVASVFPDSPALDAAGSVTAVRNCPKPPPTRISLTLPTIRTAAEVWMIVSGTAKADAVARAFAGAGERELPAAGATGRRRTLWLVDADAASAVR